MLGNNIYHEAMIDQRDVRQALQGVEQCSFHFLTGYIFVMQYPELTVPSFSSQCKLTTFCFIKLRSPIDDLAYSFGSFLYNDFNYIRVTKPIARNQRVSNVF